MIITRNFDPKKSIKDALFSIEEEINSQKLIPSGAPQLLIEGKEHKVFYDNYGNVISSYYGVIAQQVRVRNEEEMNYEVHYAVQSFGFTTSENTLISVALENVDAEITKVMGSHIGEVQMFKEHVSESDKWTTYGGVVTQVYFINPLSRVFK